MSSPLRVKEEGGGRFQNFEETTGPLEIFGIMPLTRGAPTVDESIADVVSRAQLRISRFLDRNLFAGYALS